MESQEVSFELIEKFIESYKACGLDKTREFDFLFSIVTSQKMPARGRFTWLTSIISRGFPEAHVKFGVELEALAAASHRKDLAQILQNFATKLKIGYPLTERQMVFAKTLKQQVLESKPDVQLEPRQLTLFQFFARSFKDNRYYWSKRQGTSTRIEKVFRRFANESGALSQDDWEYLRNNFKGATALFETSGAKHPIGSLRWYRSAPITIMSNSKISNDGRSVVIDALHPRLGTIETLVKEIKMRVPTERLI